MYEWMDTVVLKKREADKLGVFPVLLVVRDDGEFLTVSAADKTDFGTRYLMIEREQLLKRYQ